jgi:hypothetical protein
LAAEGKEVAAKVAALQFRAIDDVYRNLHFKRAV